MRCAQIFHPGERNRRKGFVHFIGIDILNLHACFLQRLFGRKQRLFEHDDRVTRGYRNMVDARTRRQAMILQCLFGNNQRSRGAIANLRAGGCGDGAALLQQLHASNAFERRVKTDAFIDKVHFLAFGRFNLNADNFTLEMPSLGRRLGAAVAFQRKGIEIILGEAVLLDDHFSAGELAEHDAGEFFFEPGRFIMAKAFLHEQCRDRTHRHARHAFDAAGEHDILRSRHDGLRGKHHRLLRRTALAINGDRGNAVGKLGGEHGVAAQIHRLLATLRNAARDDIVDRAGVEIIPLGNGIENCGTKIDRMYAGELAAALASGSTDGIDNIGCGHFGDSLMWFNRAIKPSLPRGQCL